MRLRRNTFMYKYKQTNNLTMKQQLFHTDYNLLQVDDIVSVHQYPCMVNGYIVWDTDWLSSYDEDGNFNRYRSYGTFAELAELLEELGLLDNKIAIEYKSGLFVGFYDGKIRVGNRCHHFNTPSIVNNEKILERYNCYKTRCEIRDKWRKF